MRRRPAMMVCVAAFVAMSASVRAQSPSDALHAWVDAFNSRDPDRIVALYAPGAFFWGTTAKEIAVTRQQLFDYFKDAGLRPATRVAIGSEYQHVFGDVAVISGAYTFADVKDGERSNVRPARYTFVFRRAGDGWLIVDHHSSRVPEP